MIPSIDGCHLFFALHTIHNTEYLRPVTHKISDILYGLLQPHILHCHDNQIRLTAFFRSADWEMIIHTIHRDTPIFETRFPLPLCDYAKVVLSQMLLKSWRKKHPHGSKSDQCHILYFHLKCLLFLAITFLNTIYAVFTKIKHLQTYVLY